MLVKFTNNARTTIAAPISSSSTEVVVAAGQGALFPNPIEGSEYFKVTFVDAATKLQREIVNCTKRIGDTLTIVRAQEGTTPRDWVAGDIASGQVTAGTLDALAQTEQAQQAAFAYAVDSGTVNAYVVTLSPPITTRKPGLTVRIKANTSNTGASTLQMGAGSIAIVNPDGSALGAGAIVNGGIFEVIDPGSGSYQLISSNGQASSTAGGFTTGGIQWRPTAEALSGWIVANANTLGSAASGANYANANASALFAWHWNNFSNTQCPVYTSAGVLTTRGANAAADFAANKRIASYDMRGRNNMGVDTMGGAASTFLTGVPVVSGSLTTAGSVIGANLHTLLIGEIPSHQHAVYLKDNGHVHGGVPNPGGSSAPAPGFNNVNGTINTSSATTGITIGSVNGVANDNLTAAAGSGGSHNNVPLSAAGYFYIKL